MRRLLWIALGLGGGLIITLMVASLLLQQQAGKVVEDLRAPVASLRDALQAWDPDAISACTDAIPDALYLRWFEDYHSGDPQRRRMVEGIFASMAVFPSVRFDGARPDRVDVQYEIHDGSARALAAAGFVPRPEGGWSLKSVRFPVASDDNVSTAPIVFCEGDNVSLSATVDRLLETLMGGSPESFRALMMLPDNETARAARLLDDTRTQVMNCRSDRLNRMLPTVGPLPRGTRWFRVIVAAKIDGKPLRLDLIIEPKPGGMPGIRRFQCGPGREVPGPVRVPPSADNAFTEP